MCNGSDHYKNSQILLIEWPHFQLRLLIGKNLNSDNLSANRLLLSFVLSLQKCKQGDHCYTGKGTKCCVQTTKKLGCTASLIITELGRFSDFHVGISLLAVSSSESVCLFY
jgi:hypothetical protein